MTTTNNNDIDLDSYRYASLRLGADLGINLPLWNLSIVVADLREPNGWRFLQETVSHFGCYGDEIFEYAQTEGLALAPLASEAYRDWCVRVLNECHRHLACQLEPRIREAVAAMEADA